jgi:hypothetical protein
VAQRSAEEEKKSTEVVKRPGQEMSAVYNTRHLSKKAPPPPGTVVTMKKLSRPQTQKQEAI